MSEEPIKLHPSYEDLEKGLAWAVKRLNDHADGCEGYPITVDFAIYEATREPTRRERASARVVELQEQLGEARTELKAAEEECSEANA